MKLIEVLNARKVIASKAQAKGVNFGTSFKFMKFIKATDEDEKFYNEKKGELIKSLAMKDDNGKLVIENNQYKFTDENFAEINKQLNELAATEVEVSDKMKFTEQELDKMEFTIEEVAAIYELVKVDENE
jgi:hypothetical protein